MTRRRFILGAMVASPFAIGLDAVAVEPHWIKIRTVRLRREFTHRVVHFTDVHHKGDRGYLISIVKHINVLKPDFVCFTGDLIEKGEHLPEALELLGRINAPMYGVPGNHDYWSRALFDDIAKCFAGSGGAWLLDHTVVTEDGKFSITGAANLKFKKQSPEAKPGTRHILLMHYPAWVKKLGPLKFDLILAGHSHGGQVRLPFYGALIVPWAVEEFERGLFQTDAGVLYVNPGLGWFPVPIRFNCRPEITVFEI
jgi:predicted MPP superfamily phosphohydrolase